MLTSNKRSDAYSAIKKLCCLEKAIPSQVVVQKTLANEKRIVSVVQKIALQINCKLGGAIWGLRIPLKSPLVIGIDVHKHGTIPGASIYAIVATVRSSCEEYMSQVVIKNPKESGDAFQTNFKKGNIIKDGIKLCNNFGSFLIAAFENILGHFKKHNETGDPTEIMVYRESCTILAMATEECDMISEVLRTSARDLCYIMVDRKAGVKLYSKTVGKAENPAGGTVVDRAITSKDFDDFYLVPMAPSQGTVSPVHYTIFRNGSGLTPDMIQRLSYAFCHMYFNWTGVVKVPAHCQYSLKLVKLVSEHLHAEPHQKLANKLYYL